MIGTGTTEAIIKSGTKRNIKVVNSNLANIIFESRDERTLEEVTAGWKKRSLRGRNKHFLMKIKLCKRLLMKIH